MRRKERRAFGLINQARGRDQYLQELGRIRLMKVLKTALWMALIVNPLSSHALRNLSSTHSPVGREDPPARGDGGLNPPLNVPSRSGRGMRTRWSSGGVLSEHDEHPSEDEGERRRPPVGECSIPEEDSDDRRTQQEDPAERQHDPKSPGGEAELLPNATRAKRKDGHGEHHEKDEPD